MKIMSLVRKPGIVGNVLLVVAGAFLFVTPWIYGNTGVRDIAWNAWIAGAALAVLAVVTTALTFAHHKSEVLAAEILDAVFAAGAVWMFISPWVLGFTAITAAAWSIWVVAVVVAAVALFSVYDVQTHALPQLA
jgi:drug/metabolite transporter (DMT)-like permease